MGVARQSRRSSVLAERARRINRMSTPLAVLVPCAQLRTNDPVSWKGKLRSVECSYRAAPGWRNVVKGTPQTCQPLGAEKKPERMWSATPVFAETARSECALSMCAVRDRPCLSPGAVKEVNSE